MILALIEHYADGNKARFARLLGITPQTLSTWLSRGNFDYERLYSNCDGLSADWLFSGEGPMIIEKIKPIGDLSISTLIEINSKLNDRIAVQAELIGKLKERVSTLERDRGRDAQDANASIAHVG